MSCFCPSLNLIGSIKLHHILKLCGNKFLTHGTMSHGCQTILLLPLFWMVWTVLCGLSQITGFCQTGRCILEYQMNWSGLGWWVSGPSTSQRICAHSKWGCTQCRNNVLLRFQIYPLVHWWLLHMNCEILSRHTVSLSLITASSSCHQNRCLPWCPSQTSQYH